jgi:hypothetical protein
MKNKRWNGFSATNQVKARLHQTKPPNALPTSERCPGSPKARLCGAVSTQRAQFAFGHGGDHSSYVHRLNAAMPSACQISK